MPIVKWTLFNELDPVERRVRHLFEQAGLAPTPLPAADVYETSDEYIVAVDVPGYEEQELAVELSDHTLAIKGRRAKTSDEKTKEFVLQERFERQFESRFTLPTGADANELKAVVTNGVLEVHAPKTGISESKKVAVRAG